MISQKPTYEELEQKILKLESAESIRKQEHERLLEIEKSYRYLFENMIDEVHLWKLVRDEHGAIKTWRLEDINPAGLQAWGKTVQETVGKTASEIFPDYDVTAHFMPIVQKIFTEGMPYVWESYYEGSKQFLRMTSVPFGEYFIITGRDITERKLKEKVLQQTNVRLELAQRAAGSGVWDWDITTGILNWSPELFHLFGLDPQESTATFDRWRKVLHPQDLQEAENRINESIRDHIQLYNEYRIILPSGEERWINALGDTTYDEQGNPTRMIGICIDITERKRVEDALRQSENKFRQLFDNSPIGKTITNICGDMQANLAFSEMLGYSQDEFLNIKWQDITHPDDIELSKKNIDSVVSGTKDYARFTKRYIHKNGDIIWADVSTKLIRDNNGKPIHFITAVIDITERKRAEKSLQESEHRLRSLINALPDLIWLKDTNGVYLGCNARFEKFFGAKEKDIIGKTDYDFMSKDLADFFRSNDKKAMDKRGPNINEEEICFADDGHREILETVKTPLYSQDGHLLGVLGIGRDITERKKVESALHESESCYRELFNNIKCGVAIYKVIDSGNDFIFIDFNQAGEQIDGDRKVDIVGKSIFEVRPGIEQFGLIDIFKRVWETGIPESFPARIYKDDRLSKWYENFVYRLPSGEIVAVFEDITERKRAEEALATSEARMRAILESLTEGIVFLDTKGLVVEINPAVTRSFGHTLEELTDPVKDPRIKIIHSDGTPFLVEDQPEMVVLRTHQSVRDVEMGLPKPDGSISWRSVSAQPVYDSNHNFIGVVVSIFDITDFKKAEDALRESEEKHRLAMDVVSDGLWDWDCRSGSVYYSPAWCRMIEEASVPPVFDSWEKRINPEDRKAVLESLGMHLEGKTEYWEKEHRLATKSGGWKWVLGRGGVVARNTEGLPVRMVGSMVDISNRKQMEEALRKSEERYRTVADFTYDWEYWIGPDHSFIYCSPACERITGYHADEFLRDPELLKSIIHPDDRDQFIYYSNHADSQSTESYKSEMRIFSRAGDMRWIAHTCRTVSGNDGTYLGLRASNRDITDRKRVEAEREELQTQLNQAQKMESVGRLAGGVAHDFNNMLGIILGNAEMALDDLNSIDSLHAYLEEIRKAANRSADLVRQLLAFARKQTISPKLIDLNKAVESMQKMLRQILGENIDIVWIPGAKVWPVRMDPSQLDQIIANLCVNARDAIEDVGKITIETGNTTFDEAYCKDHTEFVPGEYACLTVSDNGCGISKDILQNIFEPFFTTKEIGKGTGLGLATVYGIVKQNNGFINVYSEQGKGTTFRIYLSRHEDHTDQSRRKYPAAADAGGSETILLVEDDQAILQMTTMMLERLGYHVLGAHMPGEAIRMAREYSREIHMLMTDVVMPEINGRELARNLRSLYPNIKCLFMSGYTANVIAHHGVLDEGVNFIEKPFSKQDLASKVRKSLSATEKIT